MSQGFLPLPRKLFSHSLWTGRREMHKFEAYLDLLQAASYHREEQIQIVQDKKVRVGRGQLVTSLRFLQQRWGWKSFNKVSGFLTGLQEEGLIKVEKAEGLSRITICDYDEFRLEKNGYTSGYSNGTADGTPEGTAMEQPPVQQPVQISKTESEIYKEVEYSNEYTNGYTSGYSNGTADGTEMEQPPVQILKKPIQENFKTVNREVVEPTIVEPHLADELAEAVKPILLEKKAGKASRGAAHRGGGKVLMRDSPYADVELLVAALQNDNICCHANLLYYHARALNWSNAKGEKRIDWVATIKNFIIGDQAQGKLVTNGKSTSTNGKRETVDKMEDAQFSDELDELIARSYPRK